MVDLANILNSLINIVSGPPQLDKPKIMQIALEGSGTPENSDVVGRFPYHNSTWSIYDEDML
jgi:hypothetical protein